MVVYTSRIGASRLKKSNANTFVRARAYGLYHLVCRDQPRGHPAGLRPLGCPLGWSLHTRSYIPIRHSPPSSIVTVHDFRKPLTDPHRECEDIIIISNAFLISLARCHPFNASFHVNSAPHFMNHQCSDVTAMTSQQCLQCLPTGSRITVYTHHESKWPKNSLGGPKVVSGLFFT